MKLAWDAELTGRLKLRWEQGFPKHVSRALADRRDRKLSHMDLGMQVVLV